MEIFCLDFLTPLESPLTASKWLSTTGMHKRVLKTTLNVRFQNCATHQVVTDYKIDSKC